MKTKSIYFLGLLFLAITGIFSSCSDDDNDTKPGNTPNDMVYVLNNGQMGRNNAILSRYDISANQMTADVFKDVNKKDLGDLGQCIIAYGSKLYVSVQNSGIVYVLDKDGKILSEVKNGSTFSPKMMEAYKGKVYVASYVDNTLVRIDTTEMKIDKSMKVGANPEYIKAVNGKIYVANSGGLNWSGGYNNTVSVVDPELTTEKTIEVGVNPVVLKTDSKNNLYLVSCGDYGYGSNPYVLQQINTTTDKVEKLVESKGASMFINGNRIYLLNKIYSGIEISSIFSYYDISTKEVVEKGFITDGTVIVDVTSVNFDTYTKKIYVTAANNTNTGDLYVFSEAGKLISKFDTGGVFPTAAGVCFVKK